MENELKKYNPRKILGFWEAQALATLTSKNYPTSFKAISELMNDDNTDIEIKRASNILFWGRVWRQAKTKEEVTTAWINLLDFIKNSNYQSLASYQDGVDVSTDSKERVDFPAKERILELYEDGLSDQQIIERGFSVKQVMEINAQKT
tara:strand:+ start:572 stop:1015 length:444 start_codon:yes stop_codon:yes gene_type:complete